VTTIMNLLASVKGGKVVNFCFCCWPTSLLSGTFSVAESSRYHQVPNMTHNCLSMVSKMDTSVFICLKVGKFVN
jgi:hypothetical protein